MLTVVALGMTAMLVAQVVRRLSQRVPPVQVSRSEAVRRMIRHIARRHIGELAEGDAAVVRGTASALADPLISPLRGRPCIGYHVLIRDHLLGTALVDHARCSSFAISDGTGRVDVPGDGIELAAVDVTFRVYSPPLPPALQRWLPPAWQAQTIAVSEGLLLDGMEVAACGVMRGAIGAGEHYREVQVHRELTGSPSFPLVASPDRDLVEPSHAPVSPEELWNQRALERR